MKFPGLIILTLLIFTCTVFAAALETAAVEDFLPVKVQARVLTATGMELSLEIAEPFWATVGSKGEPVEVAEILSGGALEVDGYPIVPIAGSLFRLPPRSGVVVEVLEAEFETYSDIDYAHYFGDEAAEALGKTRKPEDNWFPGTLIEAGEPGIFHDFRVGSLVTYPVQVNTARREVRVYRNIQVAVRFEGTDERNTLPAQPTKISEAFLPWYRLFLDWDESELDEYEVYGGKAQVVMRDNQTLWSNIEPWIEWKLQRGWELEFLTDNDVGTWNANNIRSELIDRYEEADPKFDYVVIIGDDTGNFTVPVSSGTGYGHGDYLYSLLDGNDQLPEVGVGRISVENPTQAVAYVNKVLVYERDIDPDDAEWCLRGAVCATSASSGSHTIYIGRYCRRAMFALDYTQVDTAWYNDNQGDVRTRMINSINNGVSFFNHRGWLSTGPTTGQIAGLTNTNMTPMVFDVTCGTGDFSNSFGINEAYMRAGTVNQPRGAIGAIGTASSGTITRFNNVLNGGAIFSMFVLQNRTMGDMILGTKINLYINYIGTSDQNYIATFNRYCSLMGDPLVWLWTNEPQILEITASDEYEIGTNSYSVIVEDEETGDPIEGAWVTLYKVDDDDQIIYRGVSGADGTIVFNTEFFNSGEFMLTVSDQNYFPYQLEVEIVNPENRIGYSELSIVDDGTNGTDGNGNGIPEAGETIGVSVTAMNFGTSTQHNVELDVTSDHDWIEAITGDVTFGDISPGNTVEGDELLLIEFAPETQHEAEFVFDAGFSSDEGTYECQFVMEAASVQFAMVEVDIIGDLEPGDTRELTLTVSNIGGSNAVGPCDAELVSQDPWIEVTVAEAEFPTMNTGQEGESGEFEIEAHEASFPGHVARMLLVIESADGLLDTAYVPVTIGSRSSTDPSGPDDYGYYAFDNTDEGYGEYVPEYDWVEICPNADDNDYDGENLNLTDTGENIDDCEVIDLPFEMQYYGETFEEMTITANGMVAMGSQGDMRNARNWIIPSPLGPDYMIAPYWDERRTSGAGSNVYTYYDEDNHRFIVEWYRVADFHGTSPCTFQIIFYEQIGIHDTWTDDTAFMFQYHTMNHSVGDASHNGYFTTGIENGDQTGGLLLSYWNSEPAGSGAPDIDDEVTIYFTTQVYPPYGSIDGTVTELGTGNPIEGLLVETEDGLHSTETDEEGYYHFEQVVRGSGYIIHFTRECYNPASVEDIQVWEDSLTTVDYEMSFPMFYLDPEEIIDTLLLPDGEVIVPITVANYGNGPLYITATVEFVNPDILAGSGGSGSDGSGGISELDDPWDEVFTVPLDAAGESRHRGVAFINDRFYISGSNNFDPVGVNKIYTYSREGEYIATFDQPVPSEQRTAQGFFDLTWDGEYLYGVDNGRLFQMEIGEDEITIVGSVEVPIEQARYLLYDPDESVLWMGDLNSEIYKVDPEGNTLETFEQTFGPRGAGLYPADPDGEKLYFISRATGENVTRFMKMNTETGDVSEAWAFDDPDGNLIAAGGDISFIWDPRYWGFISVMDNGDNDSLKVWGITEYTEWVQLLNPDHTVQGGDSVEIELQLRCIGLHEASYDFWILLEHNACWEDHNVLPATLTVIDLNYIEEETTQPVEWALGEVYPNPFNPTATVRFSLKENVMVNVKVYNLLGREVAVLANRLMQAGHHSLTFDGANLASGMYFLRFEAGPLKDVKKMILMK